jgi:DNA/RNA endonuclease YhcR with UshA esterase domain
MNSMLSLHLRNTDSSGSVRRSLERNACLTAAIYATRANLNPLVLEGIARLQGKIIGTTGTIELYRGKPEIKLHSMSQIKGAGSQPVRLIVRPSLEGSG